MPRFRLLFALFAIAGFAQRNPPAVSELEAMERFAARSGARIARSQEVDRIAGGSATAVITALVLAAQDKKMRGVRIALADADKKDEVYAEEKFLDHFLAELREVETGGAAFLADAERASRAASRCFGSGILLLARRAGAHIFGSSQCADGEVWSGLSVTSGRSEFRFTGVTPARFADAIAKAQEMLAKQ